MADRVNHQQVVKAVLDSKAVDFKAIGEMVSTLGPSLALADEPWDVFCGTMRTFVHVYQLPGLGNSAVNQVEGLAALKNAAKELQR